MHVTTLEGALKGWLHFKGSTDIVRMVASGNLATMFTRVSDAYHTLRDTESGVQELEETVFGVRAAVPDVAHGSFIPRSSRNAVTYLAAYSSVITAPMNVPDA